MQRVINIGVDEKGEPKDGQTSSDFDYSYICNTCFINYADWCGGEKEEFKTKGSYSP
jgi:hypothetical protein